MITLLILLLNCAYVFAQTPSPPPPPPPPLPTPTGRSCFSYEIGPYTRGTDQTPSGEPILEKSVFVPRDTIIVVYAQALRYAINRIDLHLLVDDVLVHRTIATTKVAQWQTGTLLWSNTYSKGSYNFVIQDAGTTQWGIDEYAKLTLMMFPISIPGIALYTADSPACPTTGAVTRDIASTTVTLTETSVLAIFASGISPSLYGIFQLFVDSTVIAESYWSWSSPGESATLWQGVSIVQYKQYNAGTYTVKVGIKNSADGKFGCTASWGRLLNVVVLPVGTSGLNVQTKAEDFPGPISLLPGETILSYDVNVPVESTLLSAGSVLGGIGNNNLHDYRLQSNNLNCFSPISVYNIGSGSYRSAQVFSTCDVFGTATFDLKPVSSGYSATPHKESTYINTLVIPATYCDVAAADVLPCNQIRVGDYPGNDVGNVGGIPSPSACAAYCRNTLDAAYFGYGLITQVCYCKDARTNENINPGFVSGRTCYGESFAYYYTFPLDEYEWDGTSTMTRCGEYTVLGGYNVLGTGATISKTLTDLTDHSGMIIQFDFMRIDSWDSEDAFLTVDGVEVWRQKYASGSVQICGGSWNDEYYEKITVKFSHSRTRADFVFSTTLSSAPNDESWGLQNIQITLTFDPVYPSGLPSFPNHWFKNDNADLNTIQWEIINPGTLSCDGFALTSDFSKTYSECRDICANNPSCTHFVRAGNFNEFDQCTTYSEKTCEPDSIDPTTGKVPYRKVFVWPDYIGELPGATIQGILPSNIYVDGTNGANSKFTAIGGSTDTEIHFGGIIGADFTICSLTRYGTGTRSTILRGETGNWLHGHHQGNVGKMYYEGWITPPTGFQPSYLSQDDWIVSCGTSGVNPVYTECTNTRSGNTVGQTTSKIAVNSNPFDSFSDFEVAEILTWPRVLSDSEMIAASTYLAGTVMGKYFSCDPPSPPPPPPPSPPPSPPPPPPPLPPPPSPPPLLPHPLHPSH